jgi:hypothetical protein
MRTVVLAVAVASEVSPAITDNAEQTADSSPVLAELLGLHIGTAVTWTKPVGFQKSARASNLWRQVRSTDTA